MSIFEQAWNLVKDENGCTNCGGPIHFQDEPHWSAGECRNCWNPDEEAEDESSEKHLLGQLNPERGEIDQGRCAACGTDDLDFGSRGDGPAYTVDMDDLEAAEHGGNMPRSYCGSRGCGSMGQQGDDDYRGYDMTPAGAEGDTSLDCPECAHIQWLTGDLTEQTRESIGISDFRCSRHWEMPTMEDY